MATNVRTIGLTGGIGSGKSTVARLLADFGATVIDADRVGHQVYAPGTPGWTQVVDRFGADIVAEDGSIDRRRLGAIVFADAGALLALNEIVHPLIGAEIARRIRVHREVPTDSVLVIEAALLVEAGWNDLTDEMWLVRAGSETVVERVCAARGLDPAQVQARIAAQASDAERLAVADVVIDNEGSLADLERRVRDAWERLTGASPS